MALKEKVDHEEVLFHAPNGVFLGQRSKILVNKIGKYLNNINSPRKTCNNNVCDVRLKFKGYVKWKKICIASFPSTLANRIYKTFCGAYHHVNSKNHNFP